jgi:hypothetical protein
MDRMLKAAQIAIAGATARGAVSNASAQIAPVEPATPQETIPSLAPPPAPPYSPTSPVLQPSAAGGYLQRGTTVLQRPRPELDPLGVHIASFFLYPKVDLDNFFEDNVFATGSGRRSDFVTVVAPQLDLKSDWSSHAIELQAGASAGNYLRTSTENFADYYASASGRLDISRFLAASGSAGFEHLHEFRDSPDSDITAKTPVEYNQTTASLGLTNSGLRIGYAFNFTFLRDEFQNNNTAAGTPIIESQRNLNTYIGNARVSYEFAPRYSAFTRFSVNRRDYDSSSLNVVNGVVHSRDSQGFRLDVGTTIDLGGVTFAEVYIGYLKQDYDDSFYGTVDGIDAGARVVWNVTQLTSITFLGDRRVQDANSLATSGPSLILSPGYLRSNVGVTVDHELLRNVLLNARVNYQNDDYQGIDRTDDRIDAGAGARYQLNRNFYVGGSYTYSKRSSAGAAAGADFTRNLILLRLGAQL